jgi:hypothetical protein
MRVSAGSHQALPGIGVVLLGTVLLFVGLAYYAMAKGRSPAWCLLALLSLIGLIVLACLPDLAPYGESRTGRRRRRRPDDYDDYEEEDDRPRRRRRRYADDEDLEDGDFTEPPNPPPLPPKLKMRAEEPIQAEAIMPVAAEHRIVACAKCQKSLRFPSALAGKKVKCPSCGDVFVA